MGRIPPSRCQRELSRRHAGPSGGRTPVQRRKHPADSSPARQNPGQTEETPRSPPFNGAKPRSSQPNRPADSHPAGQNLGQANKIPRSPPVSGAEPRPDRGNTPATARQRSKTSAQPTNRHAQICRSAGEAVEQRGPILRFVFTRFVEISDGTVRVLVVVVHHVPLTAMRQKRRLLPGSVTAAARILNNCNHRNTNEQNRSTSIHINLITMHPAAFMHPAYASPSTATECSNTNHNANHKKRTPRTPSSQRDRENEAQTAR